MTDSLGDMISLSHRWQETHQWTLEQCPTCDDPEHMVPTCVLCGHPPALNGKCICDGFEPQ